MAIAQTLVKSSNPRGASRKDLEKLVKANDGLAKKVAHRMSQQCAEPFEDLLQLARIGLIKACQRFDPGEGNAFSSFAVPYIRGEIQHFLRDHWQHLKVPRRAFELVGKVKRDQKAMADMGRSLPLVDVAIAHGMSAQEWQWLEDAVQRKPLVNIDDLAHIASDVSDDTDASYRNLREPLFAAIARLPWQTGEIVIDHWIGGMTEEKIARAQRLTVTEVRAILSSALVTLKNELEAICLD
ncbi:MAG TPA: sigma-70 family RNA polymerase sigma factor [Chroococcidiopsis sp.]